MKEPRLRGRTTGQRRRTTRKARNTFGAGLITAGALLAPAAPAKAHATQSEIQKGHFEDSQIIDRPLSDWAGDWRSVYPLLAAGTLDPVMADKAAHGDKSAAERRAYCEVGSKTDVARMVIAGDEVIFHEDGRAVAGRYAGDGHEVLTYKAGSGGVRYDFRKVGGDAGAPAFLQFSDHKIAPEKAATTITSSGGTTAPPCWPR